MSKPSSTPLWRGLHHGMSKEEVLLAHPSALTCSNPQHLHDGATAELIVKNVDISGQLFEARLFFLDSILTQVTLSLEGLSNASLFQTYLTLLRARYGSEVAVRYPDNGDLMPVGEADWLTPEGANISLIYLEGVTLNINYQARLAAEATKL